MFYEGGAFVEGVDLPLVQKLWVGYNTVNGEGKEPYWVELGIVVGILRNVQVHSISGVGADLRD